MMVARRTLAASCSHCRASILQLFITPSAPAIRSRIAASWQSTALSQKVRSHSSTPNSWASSGIQQAQEPSQGHDDGIEVLDHQDSAEAASKSNQADVPWYLQVEPPRHMPSAEPPPLPEVPNNSPAIIPSLLEYASEEMGLDDLSLLDLRELDPPPALGPNLFMLFGTARSERHLNVSAGRLVRWLRANHRVYADADGLLGPNERKTKLRRKAKKAKLLGTMGTDDTDDGIATGWICVNLGTINRSSMESSVVSEDGRIAGFGVPQTGSTIIVQVMTESRRAELGLETLWQRSLARQTQKTQKIENSSPVDQHPPEMAVLSNSSSRPTPGKDQSTGSPFSSQSRFFSTQPIRSISANPEFDSRDPLLSATGALPHMLLSDGPGRMQLIELLLVHLRDSTAEEALRTLRSPSFSKVSQMAMQNIPAEQTWALRLTMESRARQLGVEDHRTLDNTQRLIQELRLSSIQATRAQFLQLLSCIYSSPGPELHQQTSLALELLETLYTRGQPIIANDIIVAIIEALSRTRIADQHARALQRRLEELMLQAKLPYMEEPLLIRLMDAYARQHKWDQFWETWRIPPRYLQPRSEALYIYIYELMAATKSPGLCVDALRRCVQEMVIENPPIRPVGRVRDAVLDCIRVADPRAEEHAKTLPADADGSARVLANRELVKIVRELKLLY
ncbi:ATPase synthesis protein 25, mitochondrial [Xylariales sp. AK1849]|nr:ATPase synthesis protein 25, mitochondrial [Xylariales sp. AK1849]